MSLRSQYHSNADLANSGVWINFPNQANEDGSIPGFKIGRKSDQNKAFQIAIRNLAEKYGDDQGLVNFKTMTQEEIDDYDMSSFIEGILFSWRNFEPNDDGKKKKYSKKAAEEIFTDPDWRDLYIFLNAQSISNAEFKEKRRKAEAGN